MRGGARYASFYDDQQQNWSICFTTDEDSSEFGKFIALAKYTKSCLSEPKMISQDVIAGSGASEVQVGDSVEVRYAGWLWDSNTGLIGAEFDSNLTADKSFRFKVSPVRPWRAAHGKPR